MIFQNQRIKTSVDASSLKLETTNDYREVMKLKISVVVCTHNPREAYLRRTLEAIQMQTLPKDQWEFLLIDNASREELSAQWDLSWHPGARHVRENRLGLTAARLRGIEESKAELLIFVDDDNVLNPEYLENAWAIAEEWKILGAWGGRIDPEFETPAPAWTEPFLDVLAIRPVTQELWSNDPNHGPTHPWGAGMCVRKEVAEAFSRNLSSDPLRRNLGRIGTGLGSCEDVDLVLTCPEVGLGFGLFPRLRLLHLIPSGRLDEDYLMRLCEGLTASATILRAVRGLEAPPPIPTVGRRLINTIKLLRKGRIERRMWKSQQRGYQTARSIIAAGKAS